MIKYKSIDMIEKMSFSVDFSQRRDNFHPLALIVFISASPPFLYTPSSTFLPTLTNPRSQILFLVLIVMIVVFILGLHYSVIQ